MAFTYIQNFDTAQTPVGQKVNTDRQGSGGDGVYSITQYAGLPYSDRQVYIEGNITHSGNRSLKHIFSRSESAGEYTNAESQIAATHGENPVDGSESWSRIWMYLDPNFDWRTGSNGTSISTEPKIFRTFYFTNRWVNTNIKTCKRDGPDGDAFGALGFRLEVVWKSTGISLQEPWQSGTFTQPNSSLLYKAPTDNEYALFKMPRGSWFTLETYIKWDTAANGGKIMFWNNGVLLYSFAADMNIATLDTRNSPNSVIGVLTQATWGGLPYSNGNVMYTDDYIITNDRSYVEANGERDSFGNWMIGGGERNNGGNGGDDPLTILNHKVVTGETRATISWETNKNSNTVVDYGPTEDRGTFVRGDENTKNHVIELTGLEVNTQYYYRFSSRVDETGETVMDPENSTFTTDESTQPTKLFLDDLEDVSASSPVKNQVLIYDGSKWVNQGIDFDSLIEEKVVEILGRTDLVVRET